MSGGDRHTLVEVELVERTVLDGELCEPHTRARVPYWLAQALIESNTAVKVEPED